MKWLLGIVGFFIACIFQVFIWESSIGFLNWIGVIATVIIFYKFPAFLNHKNNIDKLFVKADAIGLALYEQVQNFINKSQTSEISSDEIEKKLNDIYLCGYVESFIISNLNGLSKDREQFKKFFHQICEKAFGKEFLSHLLRTSELMSSLPNQQKRLEKKFLEAVEADSLEESAKINEHLSKFLSKATKYCKGLEDGKSDNLESLNKLSEFFSEED